MDNYKTAAPMVYDNGIRDVSGVTLPPAPIETPQHLPIFFIKAEKGPVGRNYVDHLQQDIKQIYGTSTFDVSSKYFNHQTPYVIQASVKQNNCIIHRLVGKDAKDVSNVVLFLDVLETEIPVYKKDEEGDWVHDLEGNPEVEKDSDGTEKTVKGFKLLWTAEAFENDMGDYIIGTQKSRPGIQSDASGTSTQYPIMEFAAKDIGKAGDLLSATLYALTQNDRNVFPSDILSEGKMYPYAFSLNLLKDVESGEVSTVINSFGSEVAQFVLADKGKHPLTRGIINLKEVVTERYIDVPIEEASGLGGVHVYNDHYEALVKKFYEAEVENTDEFSDTVIEAGENNYHAINIFSFVNSNGSPYNALRLVDDTGSVRLARTTKVYLGGGDDGNLTDEEYDRAVGREIENYGNLLHKYQNLAKYPEADFYDTGFSIDTKMKLPNFIANRKDTFLNFATFIHGKTLSLEDQYALAVTLDNLVALFPESSVYGTGACRGTVMGGSGQIIGSKYRERVSTNYFLFTRAAEYMGARDGNWVPGRLFDRAPRTTIDVLENIDIDDVPASTRNKLWAANLNFPLSNSVNSTFFPALKTICKDDTSVLNSYFNVKAACFLNKIGHAAWREFSGSISLTDEQLCERVNEFIADKARNRFDNLYRVIPETVVTERDELRGFSWTTVIKLYANNMKTVMSLTIETHRFSDLATA